MWRGKQHVERRNVEQKDKIRNTQRRKIVGTDRGTNPKATFIFVLK
jgi:hypothetical protein